MKKQGLYDPQFEHDSCRVGFIANINGSRSLGVIGAYRYLRTGSSQEVGGDSMTYDCRDSAADSPRFLCT